MVNDVLQKRQPLLQAAARRRVHADRIRRGVLPVRAQHGPSFLPGELHQPGAGDSTSPTADPFFGLVFDPSLPSTGPITSDRDDLLGGYPGGRRYIGWQTFFDFGDGQVKNNKKVDTTISSVLFTLPVPAIAPHTQTSPTVLPQRNLLRQLTWGLPSGQAIAGAMKVPGLGASDLSGIAGVYAPFATSTPLWYYVLAEAKAATAGLTLGRSADGSSPRR